MFSRHAINLSMQGRNTMGVTVMRLDEGDGVASVEVLSGGAEAENN